MARTGVLRSRVAVFLCLALFSSLASPLLAASTKPERPALSLRIAVAECTDGTDGSVPGMATILERSLRRALADRAGIEVVSLPAGRPDRIVSARVAALSKAERGRAAQVDVVAESADPEGKVSCRAAARGEGRARPGEDRVAQVGRAVSQAADLVAGQVAQAETLRAGVMGVDDKDTVRLDRGANDGIVRGAELEIIRDGAVIGRVRVDTVLPQTCSGRLLESKPGSPVVAGDLARIVSLPATKAPARRASNTGPIIAAVLIAGTILAVALSQSGGGPAGEVSLLAADTQLPADGTSTTTISATFITSKGNPPPEETWVTFQTDLGIIAPARATFTDAKAEAELTSALTPGTAHVTARAEGGQTARVTVRFVAP